MQVSILEGMALSRWSGGTAKHRPDWDRSSERCFKAETVSVFEFVFCEGFDLALVVIRDRVASVVNRDAERCEAFSKGGMRAAW